MNVAVQLPELPTKKTAGSIVGLQQKTKETIIADIGKELKKTRTDLDISIQVAAKETNILAHYLEALEKGDWSPLPGEVYARGYLKKYSEYLDLDSAGIMAKISNPAPVHQPVRKNYVSEHKQPINLIPLFIAGALLIAALLLAFLFKNTDDTEERESLVQAMPQSLQDYKSTNTGPFYRYSCLEELSTDYSCYFSHYLNSSAPAIPYIGVN
jgi:Helix-turn-helix domain